MQNLDGLQPGSLQGTWGGSGHMPVSIDATGPHLETGNLGMACRTHGT